MTGVTARYARTVGAIFAILAATCAECQTADSPPQHPAAALYTRLGSVGLDPTRVYRIRDAELDRVVACTKYCRDVVPELRGSGRAIVADSWTAHRDEILAARPDLVVASVPYQLEAVEDILKAGVRFLGLAPHSLQDIYGDILAIAGVVGRSGEGLAGGRGHAAADRGRSGAGGSRQNAPFEGVL